jgi:Mrp family chromosome partitioning ATPase
MDVRDVGVALWRQWPLVVLILAITGGALAAGIALAPKSYAATATIVAASDPARTPDRLSTPNLPFALGLGLLLALVLAVAAAIWRYRLRHAVTDAVGVEEAATAPLLAHLNQPHDLTAMPALSPGTAEADLFRHLRLALEAQAEGGSPRVVVAGVTNGDVNVWIGANVALALAGTGRRVLLVDGRMGEQFGTPMEAAPDTPGLYDVLLGADLESALSPGPVDLLQVLPAGTYGSASVTELIGQRFLTVMDSASADFENVVVIGPPLDVCDDSRAMAVDSAIVLALVEGSVSANALRAHADRIRAVGARLLGVVLVGRQPERTAA